MIKSNILTEKAIGLINKKLNGKKLSQQDSNYLSRFVRPKLKDIASINAESLLKKLEYKPKIIWIEKKIRNIILKNVRGVSSIVVCGSAVQNNYEEYNDIDIIVATNKNQSDNLTKKEKLIDRIKLIGREEKLNLDVQIYSKKAILSQYAHNPSLIYQLKDSRIIYGTLKIPNKVELSNLDLKMKLDWSEGLDIYSNANELLVAIRNALLVLLLMNKKVDNYQLKQNLINILGMDLFIKLKTNQASKIEKRLALIYLNLLIRYLETELNNQKWGKIEIESP